MLFYSNINIILDAFVFLFVFATLTFANKEGISGERTANENEYPYAIYIIDLRTNIDATGTLLSPDKIATAAHVIRRRWQVEKVELIGGAVTVNPSVLGYQKRKVHKVVAHPKYDRFKPTINDVAYILAEAPFDINEFVKPALLGGYDPDSFSKSWDDIVARGVKCQGLAFVWYKEQILKTVRMYILGPENCQQYAGKEWYDVGVRCLIAYKPENVLCADLTGGPLVCEGKIYGIYGGSSGGYPPNPGPDSVICFGVGSWFIYHTYGKHLKFFDVSAWSRGYLPTPSLLTIAFSVIAPIHGTIFDRRFVEH